MPARDRLGDADPRVPDAVDTVREADEEIGLDPAIMHVVGALFALGLADNGFLPP